jgi:hypothetical protein
VNTRTPGRSDRGRGLAAAVAVRAAQPHLRTEHTQAAGRVNAPPARIGRRSLHPPLALSFPPGLADDVPAVPGKGDTGDGEPGAEHGERNAGVA